MQPDELQQRVLDHFHEHPCATALLKTKRGKTSVLVMQLFRDLRANNNLPPVVFLMSRTLEAAHLVLATARLHARGLGYPVNDVRYLSFSVAVGDTSVLIKAVVSERNMVDDGQNHCWLYVDEICFVPSCRLPHPLSCVPTIIRSVGSPTRIPCDTFEESFIKNVASNQLGEAEFIAHARLVNPLPQFPLLVIPD